ncbi:sugar-transfer associated ATP-grasp domain-containing protein [Microbacterium dauci]|uniref:Sugar-transfer associated ATP-grasp domain-containing protein n=1 Tax=Microbacterium dauci TaxID=3048008 RepID=A0ABT6ZGZ5_9MICO|nr:sugar-transfer associated ATP-grasp domain-containing protein [Microbacterium sp. LX3-4]MDJ1115414.1 sugar-transfer associated ATP-grasp domain-containing protein [Microbacterium sp. LX3-4]
MGAVHRLYRRVRFFVRRIVNFDADRVLQFARQSARLSSAPLWWVVIDMIWCSVRYETTFENYSEWDFRILKGRERKTYMTDPKSFHLSRRLNDNAQRAIFDDKLEFATRFGAELGREWIDLRQTDAAAFADFVARHPRIIAKNPGGVGGNGISLRDTAEITDAAAVREELLAAGQALVEEVLVQHEDMASLYPQSVNSLRMVSYLDPDGEVHVLAAVLKIGNGGVIDNFSNGGMYTMLGEDGRALHAASDEEGRPFAVHPVTGVTIAGFQVPLYEEVLALVDRLARRVPAFPYIGWDVAITPTGPVVIEGNHNSGVFQSKPSVSGIRRGLLPRYRAAMRF